MYGGAGKSGRGGGRGGSGGKRNIRTTFQRSSPAPPTGRLSIGGGGGAGSRNHSSAASLPSTSSSDAKEESFRLVRGSELNYAMIIRLAPDLVEEIKRVEAQGGEPKIKFDANANNPAGNVINVGGKDFRFTWSHEPGDLCDIYEERKSADDCNGTLVESGSAWRKLNVQRVLDESTKNHVKMRSEEAERKLKSRKAIVLDPGNPSMKNQMKALAAAETNPWRMSYKQKKEPPPKKRIPEPPSGPPKSMYKSGLLTTPTKGRHSTSPLTSSPQQFVAPPSPFSNSNNNNNKGRLSMENIFGYEATNKNNSSEKDLPSKVKNSAGLDKRGRKLKVEKSPDLRSMLVSLLKENPSGMSFKALEKAVGDAFPNSVKQIEPIIKKIATYQAPGKYILRPEVDMESSKKSSPIDRSSLLDNGNQPSPQPPGPRSGFSMIPDGNDMEEIQKIGSKPAESPDDFDKIDIEHESPDILTDKRISDGEKKVSDSERPVASSSDSGSDSDSDSDSHNSGSRSRSKSRSPVGSGSGSSSDSESDASSNSKEASDEDVDIMSSDDDKEKNKEFQSSEPGELKSPFEWKTTELEPVSILTDEKQDDQVLDVDIEKDLEDDHVGHMAGAISSPSNKGSQRAEETKHHLPGWNRPQEDHNFAGVASSERENEVEGGDLKLGRSNQSGTIPRSKSKRKLEDEKCHDGEPDHSKRLKAVNLNESLVDINGNSPRVSVPHDPFTEIPNIQKTKTGREGIIDDMMQKSYNQGTYGKSSSDIKQLSRKSTDLSARSKATTGTERSGKHSEIVERGVQREKVNRERPDDGGLINDKRLAKFPREAAVDKHTTPIFSHHKEQDMLDNVKEPASITNEHVEHSFKDSYSNHVQRSPAENGRSLRRESIDLEVGELREPSSKDNHAYKKRFERNGSFKKSENKETSSEYWNSDVNKGKSSGRVSVESRNTSIPKAGIPTSGILDDSKWRTPDHYANDSTSHHHRTGQPGMEQNHSRVDGLDSISLNNRISEANNINIESDAVTGLGSTSSLKQQDNRRVGIPPSSREKRKHQPNNSGTQHDKRKDPSRTESNDGSQKRRESSTDENSCPYSKYEKEEPELKGPIKGVSQYEEYIKEYVEKYDSYVSLNRILESYRNEFSQVAKDLEAAEGRDTARYHDLVAQLHESYSQCGAKVKRLKKIFVVLHEELTCLKRMIKDFAASYAKD